MLNTVRRWFNVLKDLSAMSEDIQELQDDIQRLDLDKCDDFDLKCELDGIEDRLSTLEDG